MEEKKNITPDRKEHIQNSTMTSLLLSFAHKETLGNTKLPPESKASVLSSPLPGASPVQHHPSSSDIDSKNKQTLTSSTETDISISPTLPKLFLLHPELAAKYMRKAFQGDFGSAEYDNCLAWIANNKYHPNAAQILSILAKLTTQRGYDRALQAFWSALWAAPHDITHKAQVCLLARCLEAARCDSRIRHRDWLLHEVDIWVPQDARRLYSNKKEYEFLWALLAQNPLVLKQTNILEKLLSALRDQESMGHLPAQTSAAEALGKLGSAAATPEVLNALVAALKNIDPPHNFSFLGNEKYNVRGNAAFALGQMGIAAITSRVLNALITTLKDENIIVRIKAAQALGKLGALTTAVDQIMAILVQVALKEEESFVRRPIALALKQLQETSKSKLPPLLVTALQDTNPYVRANAVEILGQLCIKAAMPQILDLLLISLKDKDPYVRAQAAETLGQLGVTAAKKEVVMALTNAAGKDTELGIRVLAAQALAQLQVHAAIPSLLRFLVDVLRNKEWFARFYASQAFCALGPIANTPEVAAALTEALRDKNRRIRLNAVKALSQMGNCAASPETVSALIDILADKESDLHINGARIHTHVLTLKCHAAKTLGRLGTVATTPEVIDLLASLVNELVLGEAVAWALNTLITPEKLNFCTDDFLRTCNNKNVHLAGIPLTILIEHYLLREMTQQKTPSIPALTNPWLPFVIRQIEHLQPGIVLKGNKLILITDSPSKSIPSKDISLPRALLNELDRHYTAKGLPFMLHGNPLGPIERLLSSHFHNPEVAKLSSQNEIKSGPSDQKIPERQEEPVTSVAITPISTTTPPELKSLPIDQSNLYEQLLNATIQWSQKPSGQIESKTVSVNEKKEKENSIIALKKITTDYGYDLESSTGSQSDNSNNFYQAVSNQLWRQLGILIPPEDLREKAVAHMLKNLGLYTTSVTENMTAFFNSMSQPSRKTDAAHWYALSRALHISLAIIPSDGMAPHVYRRNNPVTTAYLGYTVGEYYHSLIPQKLVNPRLGLIIESTCMDPLYPMQSSQNDLKTLGIMIPPILSSNEQDERTKKFLIAINRSDVTRVKECLDKGLSPTALDCSWSIAPIFLAACAGSIPVLEVLLAADLTKELLKQKDKSGNTTLFFAARSGRTAAVEWLFEQGISAIAANNDGHTPLSAAIKNGHVATVQYLLLKTAPILTKELSALATTHPMKDYLRQYATKRKGSYGGIEQQFTPQNIPQESVPLIQTTQESISTNDTVTTSSSASSVVNNQVMITQIPPQSETLTPPSLPGSSLETSSLSIVQLPENSVKNEEKKSLSILPITNAENLLLPSPEPDSALELQHIDPFIQKLTELMNKGYIFSITRQHNEKLSLQFTAMNYVLAAQDEIKKELVEISARLRELLNNNGITFNIGQFKPDWNQWTLTITAESKELNKLAKLLYTAKVNLQHLNKNPGFFQRSIIASIADDSEPPDISESKGYSCLIM